MAEENQSKPRPIDGKHRVVLPPLVMDELELGSDDYVIFTVEKGDVKVQKVEWEVKG